MTNMPLNSGVDNKVCTSHIQDIDKTKYDSKYEIRVNKTPTYQTQSAPALRTLNIPSGMPLPIATYVLLDFMPSTTSICSASMPLMGRTVDSASIPPQYSEYRMTQENSAMSGKV